MQLIYLEGKDVIVLRGAIDRVEFHRAARVIRERLPHTVIIGLTEDSGIEIMGPDELQSLIRDLNSRSG